ncbi:hypothetical protein ES708_13025 [subsurface metagenome]
MQYEYKKKLYKIIFIVILLGFIISLVGCDWFSLGLLNIFDPQAQIKVSYTEIDLTEGVITLEIYSINEVEFIGSGFEYDYYNGTTKISSLSKIVGATFYVAPSDTPGLPGEITTINLLLYYQEAQDYMIANPSITEITCTIDLIGTDGAGHNITKPVTFDLPALQLGVPSTITLQAAPATVTAATGSSTITATITDANGNLVADGTAVTFSTTYGTLSSSSATTTNGIATTVLTFSAGDSSSTVTATSGSVSATVVVTYSVSPGVPSAITLQAAPTTVTAVTGSSTITATVKDADGNLVADGTAVTFSTTYGTLSITSATTTNGIATTVLTFSAGDSSSTVTATSGSVSGTVVVTYTVTPGVPSVIILQAAPSTVILASDTSTITATITDVNGNLVADGTVVIFSTELGTLSLSSTTTTNGIARTVLTYDNTSGADKEVTVTANSGSVSRTVVVTFEGT